MAVHESRRCGFMEGLGLLYEGGVLGGVLYKVMVFALTPCACHFFPTIWLGIQTFG